MLQSSFSVLCGGLRRSQGLHVSWHEIINYHLFLFLFPFSGFYDLDLYPPTQPELWTFVYSGTFCPAFDLQWGGKKTGKNSENSDICWQIPVIIITGILWSFITSQSTGQIRALVLNRPQKIHWMLKVQGFWGANESKKLIIIFRA